MLKDDIDKYFDEVNKKVDTLKEANKEKLYNILYSPLDNYYGTVFLKRVKDKYYLELENYDYDRAVEVSPEFATAFIKEFKDRDIDEEPVSLPEKEQ